MVIMAGSSGASSSRPRKFSRNQHDDGIKYARYSLEQVEILEKVYAECPKPSLFERQEIINKYPTLSNIASKQIKVWFQNRRCRDKQRKETVELESVTQKLTAANKLLLDENDRLKKQVTQLVHENEYLRHQLQNATATDTSCESAVCSPPRPSRASENSTGLLLLAEETIREFLPKATENAVDWVPIPGMKPGSESSDSVGTIYISHNCEGVAARACSVVTLDPTKVMEILKDRPSWCRDCRKVEIFSKFPTGNGGMIELIYMQFYSSTTLACGHDFWTLRYTSTLEDGTLVVCEKSIPGSVSVLRPPVALEFARGKMLASGFLIRPCEGRGSIVHIVDHLDYETLAVPVVLRPLYQSSKLVAQKMTAAALHHIEQVSKERSGKVTHTFGKKPGVLRSFGHRLMRGFNDAINGFRDGGWSLINYDATEELIISVNPTKNLATNSNNNALCLSGGILCVKASMLFQDVSPELMVRFLLEHRSDWAEFSSESLVDASLAGSYNFPGLISSNFSGSGVLLGHTVNDDEILEIIRLEGHILRQDISQRDKYLLQLCNGMEENGFGTCSELIFAPIDEMLPDDAMLLSSGFRILSLGSNTCDRQDNTNQVSNIGACPAAGQTGGSTPANESWSVVIIAFQFPFESHLQESVATMAQQYVRSVISCVRKFSTSVTPTRSLPAPRIQLSPGLPEDVTLVNRICQSYRSNLGGVLLSADCEAGETVVQRLWHHHYAIFCYSFKSPPVCIYANEAGLNMLETTLVGLQEIVLHQIFGESGQQFLHSVVPTVRQQGYAMLSTGVCVSVMGHYVSYEHAVAWKVLDEGGELQCIAFAFINWSFV